MDSPTDFDRAHGLRSDLDQLDALLSRADTLLLPLHKGQLPVIDNPSPKALALPVSRAAKLVDIADEIVFLGSHGGRAIFAVDLSSQNNPLGLEWLCQADGLRDLRYVASRLSALDAHLMAYARGMLHFHQSTAFCGTCGGHTKPRKGGHMRQCTGCAKEHHPRTDPAVLVLARYGQQVLLGRSKGWPPGMYSTLAGFVEPGESLEAAVRREVHEETGVQLGDVRYAGSQPWPMPASVMLGFTATAQDTAIVLDDELEDARFFTREQLTQSDIPGFFVPPPYSLAGRLIQGFMDDSTP